MLTARKPGDAVRIRISRNGAEREISVLLGRNAKPVYAIVPFEAPDPLQAAIRKDWLRKAL